MGIIGDDTGRIVSSGQGEPEALFQRFQIERMEEVIGQDEVRVVFGKRQAVTGGQAQQDLAFGDALRSQHLHDTRIVVINFFYNFM